MSQWDVFLGLEYVLSYVLLWKNKAAFSSSQSWTLGIPWWTSAQDSVVLTAEGLGLIPGQGTKTQACQKKKKNPGPWTPSLGSHTQNDVWSEALNSYSHSLTVSCVPRTQPSWHPGKPWGSPWNLWVPHGVLSCSLCCKVGVQTRPGLSLTLLASPVTVRGRPTLPAASQREMLSRPHVGVADTGRSRHSGSGCADAMGAAGYKLPCGWHPQACLPLLASALPGSATWASPHPVCPAVLVTPWDLEPLWSEWHRTAGVP